MSDKFKAAIEKFIAAYNSFDVEAMLEQVHEEVVFTNQVGDEINVRTEGINQLARLAEQSMTLFKSREQRIKSITIDGDKARVEIDFEGILAQDLPNGLKAGEAIVLSGHSDYIFKDDKLISITDYS